MQHTFLPFFLELPAAPPGRAAPPPPSAPRWVLGPREPRGEELRGDKDVVLAAVAQNGAALQRASQELPGPSSGRARRG